MESWMIFDPQNYIVTYKCNKKFYRKIVANLKQSSINGCGPNSTIKSSGSPEPGSSSPSQQYPADVTEEIFTSYLTLLFAPYVASKRIFQSKSPDLESSIAFLPRCIFSFAQYQEFFLLYICEENKYQDLRFLQRRVDFMSEVMKFMFSSAASCLKDTHEYSHRRQGELMASMIDVWEANETRPRFMVEAIERLLVSMDIRGLGTRLMQFTLAKIRSIFDSHQEIPCHAFLFVDTKLLGSSSSRNSPRIAHKDLFLLALLLKTMLPSQSEDEYEFDGPSVSTTEEDYEADQESESENDPKENHSQASSGSDKHDEDDIDLGVAVDPINDDSLTASEPSSSSFMSWDLHQKDHSTDVGSGRRFGASRGHDTDSLLSSSSLVQSFRSCLVFLQPYGHSLGLVPFILRIVPIDKDKRVNVLILSEVPPARISLNVSKLLDLLFRVQFLPKDSCCLHIDNKLKMCAKDLRSQLTGWLGGKSTNRALIKKLDQVISSNIYEYIADLNENKANHQMDNLLPAISQSLRELFISHVFRPSLDRAVQVPMALERCLVSIKSNVYAKLNHYLPYLVVKSDLNVPISAFKDDTEPQLCFFLYLDRTYNEMMISSFGCQPSDADYQAPVVNLIPRLIDGAYRVLSEGKFSYQWNEGPYILSYFMWFEDATGMSLKPGVKRFSITSYPSIVTMDFIDRILNWCFPKYANNNGRTPLSLTPPSTSSSSSSTSSSPMISPRSSNASLSKTSFLSLPHALTFSQSSFTLPTHFNMPFTATNHHHQPRDKNAAPYCYELFCIHKGLESIEKMTIIEKAKKLAAQLWTMSSSATETVGFF